MSSLRASNIALFDPVEVIGRGDNGIVKRGYQNGNAVAVKQIPLIKHGMFVSERSAMQRLAGCEGIVPILAAVQNVDETGEGSGSFCMIAMPYYEKKDLTDFLVQSGRFEQEVAAYYAIKLLTALSRAHRLGVANRDIKCDNIFIGDDFELLFGDWGSAAVTESAAVPITARPCNGLRSVSTTPQYAAPELATAGPRGLPYAADKADMWSLGCAIFTMVFGVPPCSLRDEFQQALFAGDLPCFWAAHEVYFGPMPSVVKSFFDGLFQEDAELRSSAEEMLEHPWLECAWPQARVQAAMSARYAAMRVREDAGMNGASGVAPENEAHMVQQEVHVHEMGRGEAGPSASSPPSTLFSFGGARGREEVAAAVAAHGQHPAFSSSTAAAAAAAAFPSTLTLTISNVPSAFLTTPGAACTITTAASSASTVAASSPNSFHSASTVAASSPNSFHSSMSSPSSCGSSRQSSMRGGAGRRLFSSPPSRSRGLGFSLSSLSSTSSLESTASRNSSAFSFGGVSMSNSPLPSLSRGLSAAIPFNIAELSKHCSEESEKENWLHPHAAGFAAFSKLQLPLSAMSVSPSFSSNSSTCSSSSSSSPRVLFVSEARASPPSPMTLPGSALPHCERDRRMRHGGGHSPFEARSARALTQRPLSNCSGSWLEVLPSPHTRHYRPGKRLPQCAQSRKVLRHFAKYGCPMDVDTPDYEEVED